MSSCSRRRIVLPVFLTMLVAAVLSCVPSPSASPTAPPSATAAPPPTLPPSASPTGAGPIPATEAPVPPTIPSGPLSSDGPWLVFVDGSDLPLGGGGLWAVNPDGSGLTLLADQLVGANDPLAHAVPLGRPYVAYVTGRDGYYGLTLNIVSLPSGDVLESIPLTSVQTEPTSEDISDRSPRAEAIETIFYNESLAWSPDGLKLAFAGVIDGPSSDVYVYSLEDGSITRLTDGPSQVAHLSWSPDGQYIFHVGVDSFGTGAGYGLAGVWVVRADGGGVRSLYDPGDSGDEVPIGWFDDETVILHSWDAWNGSSGLRMLNVRTGAVELLFPDPFGNVAWSQSMLMVTQPLGAESLLLIAPRDASWLPLPGYSDASAVYSWQANSFFALADQGTFAVWPDGTITPLAAPPGSWGVPSAGGENGQMLAWSGEGIWIGSLQSPQVQARQIFSGSAYDPEWGPEAAHLLFFAGDGLYTAAAPGYAPARVEAAPTTQPVSIAWVWSWR